MSRLQELSPDQRAALSLLVRQRKSYAEVATLLRIDEQAVRARAHAALAVLAPGEARQLTPPQREQVGDYLLGQAGGVAAQLRTRTHLSDSPAARAWALALVSELAPLAEGPLPEVPAPAAVAPPPAQAAASAVPTSRAVPATRALPSSRVGGAIVLAAIVAAVVVAVVLLSKGGSAHKNPPARAATSSTSSKNPVRATLPLRSPDPASRSVGLVYVLAEGATRGIYIAAEHLPPSHRDYYAIWLYNSATSFRGVSVTQVGASGRIQGGSLLPAEAGEYHTILLTREHSAKPTHPGHVVLSGAFALTSG